MHVRPGILVSAAFGGIALCACGGRSAPAGPATTAVTIKNFAFSPGTVTVSPGTKVTWTQDDSSVHTVTAVDGSFDSGNLAQSQAFSHTFSTAGSFAYRCNIHQYMTATVVVR
ncbi:MAG TPA: cupredoxin family copper-binding protein [Candidatus Dormibacteraeota bacterium]